jgi:acyl-CoA synthetase (AMP-forming)/AMP-acid ligase II
MTSTDAPWQTIPELVADSSTRYADLEAIVDGELRLNYAAFGDRIHEATRAHIAWGMVKGDRFAVWAPNVWEWPVAALGGLEAGGILVPVNTRFKGREAAYVLRKSQARILFTVTDFLDTDYVSLLREADEDLPHLEQIVVLRGPVPDGCISYDDFIARSSEVDDTARAERAASVDGDDVCLIMFTSGTTGAPKGAMLVHKAICKAYLAWADVVGLRAGDRYIVINPFFHSFGFNAGILVSVMKGVCIVPHPVFDVPSVMRRIPEERISVLVGPPAIYQTILNHPDLEQFDMSTLRLSVTGAAAVPVEMILQMRERLNFEVIVTGYGLTECSGIATMCRHDDDPETIAHTSGRAIPDIEVLVVDPEGKEVPRGEPGEIVVRGYNVMKGYLDDPEQTAEAIDADGWLHTGDVGTMNERGYVDITDRVKDMFINGGFNAYPAEIEDLMLRHPHIGQVAVVGVPDDRLGEVGMAFVIARPGTKPDPDEIIAWARGEMANYKAPRFVEVVDTLPLNASGKVLKYELRERAKARAAAK